MMVEIGTTNGTTKSERYILEDYVLIVTSNDFVTTTVTATMCSGVSGDVPITGFATGSAQYLDNIADIDYCSRWYKNKVRMEKLRIPQRHERYQKKEYKRNYISKPEIKRRLSLSKSGWLSRVEYRKKKGR